MTQKIHENALRCGVDHELRIGIGAAFAVPGDNNNRFSNLQHQQPRTQPPPQLPRQYKNRVCAASHKEVRLFRLWHVAPGL